MRISFDMDGVITDGDANKVFTALRQSSLSPEERREAALRFYSSCKPKYFPSRFMKESDTGFIVTSRQPEAQGITHYWLRQHHILLPVYFADPLGDIDWGNYEVASREAGKRKARIIQAIGSTIHYDNNPVIASELGKVLPGDWIVVPVNDIFAIKKGVAKGLCGKLECNRLCARAQYCQLGQERVHKLLAQQRERREARHQWSVVGQSIEAAIPVFAGPFESFQRQLQWERQQLAEEMSYAEFLGNYKEG